ncbi:hypothetical protein [Aliarcobacter butzleri]|uniref:Uncharacterized protein n=1 Tax=Aliarcobacter butzleri L351 TaxID=1447259 RepID=A0A837J7V2_9BACT|nr:hypothetical protein [Aliarcobacter butzleri]KLE02742.1 hypothetical protein AF76_01015 [Aliarcobacter butzleri L351]KLE13792.1 hypothetical protein AF75_01650 [Aliarcobacter butzleri L350]
MTRAKIGDIFSIQISKGKVFFQYTNSERGKEYIKIFEGIYEDTFSNYEDLLNINVRFMISYSVKLAYKHKLIDYEYYLPLIGENIPKYTRTPWTLTGKFEGWLIENTTTKERRLVQYMTDEEKNYSPSGWVNHEYLIEMLEMNFKLQNWDNEYILKNLSNEALK